MEQKRGAGSNLCGSFGITKSFPVEERYSMVDQIRRCSRSVCSNLAEGWRKRTYEAVFRNKLTDSMQEASETQCWLEFAHACSYITFSQFDYFPPLLIPEVQHDDNTQNIHRTIYLDRNDLPFLRR